MNHEPQDHAPRDSDLHRRVVAYLRRFDRTPLRRIEVEVQEGRVTLRGRVSSFYEKQLCLGCIRSVPGLSELRDLIEVV